MSLFDFGGRGRVGSGRSGKSRNVLILRRKSALEQGTEMIARHELKIWWEPDWRTGMKLAKRFPDCTIVSVPIESDTVNLLKLPAWRAKLPIRTKV